MSHYVVHVITKTKDVGEVERLLAPYDENIEVAPHRTNTKLQDAIVKAKDYYVNAIKEIQEKIDKHEVEKGHITNERKRMSGMKKVLKLTDIEILNDYYGHEILNDGEYVLSTYNPNSKWDWYTIGGRWDGELKTKSGSEENNAKISDIDITVKIDKEEATKFWKEYVEGADRENEKYKHIIWNPDYYKEQYGTLENYLYRLSINTPFAVLTPDGVWHAPGEMGWFGCDTSDKNSQDEFTKWYIDYMNNPENKDYYVTLVDCHI